jgi:hypothetical protein
MEPSANRTDWGRVRWPRIAAAVVVLVIGAAIAALVDHPIVRALAIVVTVILLGRLLRSN